MRYHYTRFFSQNSENILKQPAFRKRVDRRGRLIKYKHLGIFAVCAGDNQALLFPSRQFNAVIEKLFAVRSVQTDIRDLFIHPRFFKRGLYQVISLDIIEDQILTDRKGVQNIILKYGSKFCLIGIKIVFPYVLSLVIDLAFRRIDHKAAAAVLQRSISPLRYRRLWKYGRRVLSYMRNFPTKRHPDSDI